MRGRAITKAAGSTVLPRDLGLAVARWRRWSSMPAAGQRCRPVVKKRYGRIDRSPIVAYTRAMDYPDHVTGPAEPACGQEHQLPWGWHHFYCLPYDQRLSDVGEDGHEQWLAPPGPYPHRVWGGATIEWHRQPGRGRRPVPLMVGDRVRLEERVTDMKPRRGTRGGEMVIVNLEHRWYKLSETAPEDDVPGSSDLVEEEEGLVITENRSLIYRKQKDLHAEEGPDARRTIVHEGVTFPGTAEWRSVVKPDAVLLFRFSALTYNSHKIHYDHRYAVNEEGYRGVLVHGPLTSTMLLDSFRHAHPKSWPVSFHYRAVRPLVVDEPITLEGMLTERDPMDDDECQAAVWAKNKDGDLAMWGVISYLAL